MRNDPASWSSRAIKIVATASSGSPRFGIGSSPSAGSILSSRLAGHRVGWDPRRCASRIGAVMTGPALNAVPPKKPWARPDNARCKEQSHAGVSGRRKAIDGPLTPVIPASCKNK
jgi:hypothetical protein